MGLSKIPIKYIIINIQHDHAAPAFIYIVVNYWGVLFLQIIKNVCLCHSAILFLGFQTSK